MTTNQGRYHSRKYHTESGPTDPVIGPIFSILGTVGGLVSGAVDLPIGVGKAVANSASDKIRSIDTSWKAKSIARSETNQSTSTRADSLNSSASRQLSGTSSIPSPNSESAGSYREVMSPLDRGEGSSSSTIVSSGGDRTLAASSVRSYDNLSDTATSASSEAPARTFVAKDNSSQRAATSPLTSSTSNESSLRQTLSTTSSNTGFAQSPISTEGSSAGRTDKRQRDNPGAGRVCPSLSRLRTCNVDIF
jgi:hypothetical protein